MIAFYVAAGDERQYDQVRYTKRLQHCAFIDSPEMLYGALYPTVLLVGTYWTHPQWDRIKGQLRLREATILKEAPEQEWK